METLECGHPPSKHIDITTGYGTGPNGKRHCYDCVAVMDNKSMIKHGDSKALPLYLCYNYTVDKGYQNVRVTNWPGSLKFKVWGFKKGYHNIARTRYDFWFHGPDEYVWHGIQYGEMTQIAHCKRTKERSQK